MGLFSFFKKKKNKTATTPTVSTNEAVVTTSVTEIDEVKEEKTENAVIEDATVKTEEVKAAEKPLSKPREVKATDTVKKAEKTTRETNGTEAKKEEAKKPASKKVSTAAAAPAEKPAEKPEVKKAYSGRFEINASKNGDKYFFNLYASNKVGICTSQMYSSASSALAGVNSVIKNAPTAPVEDQTLKTYDPASPMKYPKWEIYLDKGEKYRFRLNASNGSCVCHSQGYTTKTACKNGINSIIRSAANPEIDKAYLIKPTDIE